MIAVPHTTPGDERLGRLYTFADDVLAVCDALGIEPVLDGSLAVRAYTRDSAIAVRDIDFSYPEAEFPRLQRALKANAIACELRDWHVLQARRGDLKVEFGATEVWMAGIAGPYETVRIGNRAVRMVSREALRELYQRGFDATRDVASQCAKHKKMAAKIRALDLASDAVDLMPGTISSNRDLKA